MSLTPAQQQAVSARGNVLVVAGAGTGKTRALVERCLDCLIHEQPPVSLDEILVVTFTDAAAAEMRQRLRRRLEEELAKALDRAPAAPVSEPAGSQVSKPAGRIRWQEQLALFETAHIGTLHSFCLQLVRQHFLALGLDPQLVVLPEEEASLLAVETLDGVLEKHYAGRDPLAQAVQSLIQFQGRGREDRIRTLVRRLHRYTQTLPDPRAWFDTQLGLYSSAAPAAWLRWLVEGIAEWRAEWLPVLEALQPENELARDCLTVLSPLAAQPSRSEAAAALEQISNAAANLPSGKKTERLKPLKNFIAEAEFLASLAAKTGDKDPLAEDWSWVRSHMSTLLKLAQEFAADFSEAKRERAGVDFHDLEQYALRVLWDPATNQPSDTARQWRQKLRFVFVDEYQDINAAQDRIIEALSREGDQANRFLVGDVKQSIYRFRLANPRIFQAYIEAWGMAPNPANPAGELTAPTPDRQGSPPSRGRVIPLVDNFRSREGILNFVNAVFGVLMRGEIGGVEYDEQAQLQFGAPEQRPALAGASGGASCVELHLRVTGAAEEPEDDEDNGPDRRSLADLAEADKEARLVALRLAELKAGRHPVWDEEARAFRPVEWRDMAILLRSPANKAESYAKEFARLNLPLLVTRTGFYESLEVLDLLSLLRVLDNPLQDLPVLATLHSPLVGLTLDELATIRLAASGRFWNALLRSAEGGAAEAGAECDAAEASAECGERSAEGEPESPLPAPRSPLRDKITGFLDRFARWRRLARQVSLTRCLETVLEETHYAEWLLTQPRGDQRHANLQRLLGLAQQFDQFQRRGLFRFLRFIDAQQEAEAEPDVAAGSDENAVRLMSIHQSKGLEFPVVVVADLGKAFNLSDLRADIILDETLGLCPEVQPPLAGARYPSLPHWLASRREKRQLLGEELRLLYVAMTRARDALLLSASVSRAKLDELWNQPHAVGLPALLSANSYADWLGRWLSAQPGPPLAHGGRGQNALLAWALHDDAELLQPGAVAGAEVDPALHWLEADPAQWQELERRLTWTYPFAAAAHQPAKTSVTALRRQATEDLEEDVFALFGVQGSPVKDRSLRFKASTGTSAPGAAAADLGNAHHQFQQFVSLERVGSVEELAAEAQRLEQQGALTEGAARLLNFQALAAFWDSELGRRVRAQSAHVRRELRFTARFLLKEIGPCFGQPPPAMIEEEFVLVQGVADLVVLLPREIWLVDYKTDALEETELARRAEAYGPQLGIYAQALSRIYQRPVSERWLYFLAAQKAVAVGA